MFAHALAETIDSRGTVLREIDGERTDAALAGIEGKRLTYHQPRSEAAQA